MCSILAAIKGQFMSTTGAVKLCLSLNTLVGNGKSTRGYRVSQILDKVSARPSVNQGNQVIGFPNRVRYASSPHASGTVNRSCIRRWGQVCRRQSNTRPEEVGRVPTKWKCRIEHVSRQGKKL